jgi:Domain of unknown function (DUF4833)
MRRGPGVALSLLLAGSALRLVAQAPPSAAKLPAQAVQSVFHIAKSENKNQVHYAVQVDADCRPTGKRPVYGFWRDLELGQRAVSSLLKHEQPAYGLGEPRFVRVHETGGGEVRVSLRGFPDRPLTVETFKVGKGCGARALTTIQGQVAMLTSIYVEIGFLCSVDYAIVRGLRVSDGSPVQEKVHD